MSSSESEACSPCSLSKYMGGTCGSSLICPAGMSAGVQCVPREAMPSLLLGMRAFFFGRGAGTYSPVPYLITLEKYFWAWERAWKTERVPTCAAIFFQSRW